MKPFVFFMLWSVFSASVIFGAAERDSVFLLHDRILVLKDRVEAGAEAAASAFRELRERVPQQRFFTTRSS